MVGFKLNNRALYAPFEGRVLPLPLDDAQDAAVVLTLVTRQDSEAAKTGDDVVVRVCSSGCEKAMRSVVPKALRRLTRELNEHSSHA
jgi:hypothetical protein